jgi:RNA polymerase sigma-70 factor (ECF subfamily)
VNPNGDEATMLRVREGEVEHLADLYARYRTPLFNFFVRLTGHPHLSEDLLQEVFLRVLKYRHSFKPGNRFETWLYQIARNAHHDAWRKRRHESVVAAEDLDDREPPWGGQPSPDWAASRNQEIALLQEALGALPVESREVLVLSRFQGLKYEEIARILNCNVGAVKMRVYRALLELRRGFSELAGKETV